MKTISIIIPVYNEVSTICQIIKKVEDANFCNLKKEIIIVDDGSEDGSKDYLNSVKDKYKVIFHPKNMGKGKAINTALKAVTSDIVVIQDADLEYDPTDYEPLIQLILDDRADVVYGSRLSGAKASRSFMFLHFLGNKLLTLITNLLYNVTLTDMETCYKAFKKEFIKDIEIKSSGFDFEPEITAKVIKKKARLYELPISYYGREYSEGKKITYKDGFSALFALIKYRFTD